MPNPCGLPTLKGASEMKRKAQSLGVPEVGTLIRSDERCQKLLRIQVNQYQELTAGLSKMEVTTAVGKCSLDKM